MDAWFIASVPAWTAGATLIFAGWWAPFHPWPNEAPIDIASSWIVCNALGIITLCLAAWMAS